MASGDWGSGRRQRGAGRLMRLSHWSRCPPSLLIRPLIPYGFALVSTHIRVHSAVPVVHASVHGDCAIARQTSPCSSTQPRAAVSRHAPTHDDDATGGTRAVQGWMDARLRHCDGANQNGDRYCHLTIGTTVTGAQRGTRSGQRISMTVLQRAWHRYWTQHLRSAIACCPRHGPMHQWIDEHCQSPADCDSTSVSRPA